MPNTCAAIKWAKDQVHLFTAFQLIFDVVSRNACSIKVILYIADPVDRVDLDATFRFQTGDLGGFWSLRGNNVSTSIMRAISTLPTRHFFADCRHAVSLKAENLRG